MADLIRDLRLAARSLRRAPLFTGLGVLVLAAGIAATCTAFGALQAVLLSPLAIEAPERVVFLWESQPAKGETEVEVSYPNFADWRDQNHVFTDVATMTSVAMGFTLTGRGEPRKLASVPVSGRFFALLGAQARLGRLLASADEAPGAPVAAVISDALYRSLGGDPAILGTTLTLDGQAATVVGVLGPEFDFPRGAQLWTALQPTPGFTDDRSMRALVSLARLRPGVELPQARREMEDLAARLAAEHPKENAGCSVTIEPLLDKLLGGARTALWALFGGVLLVLLIACANVASLFLARAAMRAKELAVHAAFGAGRARLARLLLLETALVAGAGGALGLLLAHFGLRLLVALAPREIPRIETAAAGWQVAACAALATAATALLAGAAPALRFSRPDLMEVLKSGGGWGASLRGSRLLSGLVAAEVALAVVLVSGAGLLLQTWAKLSKLDPGFEPRGVLTARIELNQDQYPEHPKRAALYSAVLEGVRALPGVESAGLVLIRPLSGTVGWDLAAYGSELQSPEEQAQNPYANYEAVSAGYFQTLRIPLLRGRDFGPGDTRGAPLVTIVSDSLAKRLWPGQDPLGRLLLRGKPGEQRPPLLVVGVVKDVRYREWEAVRPDVYVPFTQKAEFRTDLVIRTTLPPLSLALSVGRVVAAADPAQPLSEVATLEELVGSALTRPRFTLVVLGGIAAIALLLAMLGVYGLVALTVALRGHELGVRMALGAGARDLLLLVAGQGVRLALLGVALGLPAAAALARLASGLLYGVAPSDPRTLLSVAALALGVATLAALGPALRAARAEPMRALREE